ncbi:hypothetical protein COO59_16400 [Mixta theicola]|uniref:Phytanoyl-CoA dioxygenase n=1 Tax=Mixta theicola TaxID=1458355 RepID=A0A2K1Q6M3_9GAMM|nr:hypothetical protein [Mixta theicola]PNS10693.1 hypothetical protein COO59_16400 [Mixta theicola]GLR10917.1 hypothetical protein GCM10007905_36370 [Mixta theicola]
MSFTANIDPNKVPQLLESMENQGYAVLENAVTDEGLARFRYWIDEISAGAGKGYHAIFGDVEKIDHTPLAELSESADFRQLMQLMAEKSLGRRLADQNILAVLRCVQGESGKKKSNTFHYDASVITALLPIEIPQEGEARGDLILFPNLRRFRSSVLFNVLEKTLMQNRLSRYLLTKAIKHRLVKPMTLYLQPGNIYFFHGYRSFHANGTCDPAFRRATALFHFGDPHYGSALTRSIIKVNRLLAK